MELRTLHYFVTVAQELNITRAAEKLNMSQPPLSNQIKGLEEELGAQLLIRGKRHLELTEEGRCCCAGPSRFRSWRTRPARRSPACGRG